MKKHILLIIWIIIFFGIAVHLALISVLFGRPDYYDIIISVEVIIFFLLIPLIIIDLKLSSRQKIKNKMQEKNLELLKKEAEIEELKRQRELITEDDIIISKEKHTCLVHKGLIRGYSFICPECGAFYCIKCIDAIIQIENACWSCQNPLDPSQQIKKIEDDIPIETEILKLKQRYCTFCGKRITQDLIICPYCGKNLKR